MTDPLGALEAADPVVLASERAMKEYEVSADTLVGATIGNLTVVSREKPARRAFYVCEAERDGSLHRLRGYELVHLAREARRNGLAVVMPREPWRDDEEGVA